MTTKITDLVRIDLMIGVDMFPQEKKVLTFNQNLQNHQDKDSWIILSPMGMSLTFRPAIRSPSPMITQTLKG